MRWSSKIKSRRFNLAGYLKYVSDKGASDSVFDSSYLLTHEKRFQKTIEFLDNCTGRSALEIGATDFFQMYLQLSIGFSEVWGTIFAGDLTSKLRKQKFQAAGCEVLSTIVDLQLEDELFPVADGHFDLVMLCEVLEHLDVDPMFCLNEINRITRRKGRLLLTTPNSCSARNAYKCCLGYRPHFYMQYHRDRSRYRHNFEHDVHSVTALLKAAGFRILRLETHDVFEETSAEAIEFLRGSGLPLENRGDDIFVLAEKISAPKDRWPAGVYT